jgi:hypothetical protein
MVKEEGYLFSKVDDKVYKLTFQPLWIGVLFVLVITLSNMHPFV